jgi:hypothetical protein
MVVEVLMPDQSTFNIFAWARQAVTRAACGRNCAGIAARARLLAGLGALLLAVGAHAGPNKCQDASGRITYTDQACPSTSTATPTPAARTPKRVEVAPPPQVDVSGLPRDAQGRPILSRSGDATLVLEQRAPGPTNVLAACSSMVTRCYQPGQRELDDCFASAPRCTSARPWEDPAYQPCCPEACWRQYDATRKAGAAPLAALDQALFGGGSPAKSCLPPG